MKTSFSKFLLAGLSALAGLGFVSNAQAILAAPTAPYAVYSFNGNCADCAQAEQQESHAVTGSLTLQSFMPGGAVGTPNLYSLSYGGSNLFGAFTAYGSDVISAGGFNMTSDAFPASANATALNFYATFAIYLPGDESRTQVFFESKDDGSFRLGFGDGQFADNDNGNGATWTLSQTVNAPQNDVPEPGSLLLMGAALVAVGVARRKRA